MQKQGKRGEGLLISSVKHPGIVEARRSLGKAGRQPPASFMVDGHRLVSQALAAQAPIEKAFFLHPVEDAEDEVLLQNARDRGVECHLVTRGVFFRLLDLGYETSVRVMATVSRSLLRGPGELTGSDACVLVGERIQDPRNVGVLIRTADAWGLTGVAFGADSADPCSRASVRSSTGSIFSIPVTVAAEFGGYLRRLKEGSLNIIGTSAHAQRPCWDADLSGPCAILLGNETSGLSDEAREACDVVVRIPMTGRAHSLNVTVAAGIVLYERARQRRTAG